MPGFCPAQEPAVAERNRPLSRIAPAREVSTVHAVFRDIVGLGGSVGRRLLRLEIPVFPERGMFRVHDPIGRPGRAERPGAPAR